MNTKHTSGPWQYRPKERLIWAKVGEGLMDNLHVAKVCQQAEETEANARLIAAAPELLELAQLVMKWDSGELAGHIPVPVKVAAAARAAIAKATGTAA